MNTSIDQDFYRNLSRNTLLAYSFLFLLTNSSLSAEEENVAKEERRVLTELTITADPFNHNLLEHSSPATILEKNDVILKAEPTIAETIGQEPGITTSYFGPGSSRPIIRGNAGDRVRVLKNGIGTLDISNTSEDHTVTSNPIAAESIEILRGPETLLFGSSAIGGIVNVTDNAIPENYIGEPLNGSFDYRQGTADDELSGALKLEGQAGKYNWHLDYFHQDTEDIDIPDFAESANLRAQEAAEGEEHEDEISRGKLLNSATRSQGFTAGSSRVWDKGFLGVSISSSRSKYGVPGHAHESHAHEDDAHEGEEEHHDDEEHGDEHHDELGDEHHADEDAGEHSDDEGVAIDLEQVRLDVRGRVDEVNDFVKTAKFNLGISTYQHDELEDGGIGTEFENDAFEGRVEITHEPISSFEGVLGFQIQGSDFSAVGEEAYLPQIDTIAPSLFLFEELPLNKHWKLHSGARYDFVRYSPEGLSSEEFNPLGLSTGVVWNPTGESDYTLGLSVAYTQRAPSASELFADGAHIARQIFELGNTDIDVEQSFGVDLTMKKNTGLVTGMLNLFAQDYEDYINLSNAGEEEDGLPLFNYESVDALFWGFEAKSTLHLHEALNLWSHDIDFDVQVDFVRAEDKSNNTDLPRIPPLRTIVGIDYKYKRLFEARAEGVFASKQDDIAEFELPTDSYKTLNAHLNFNLPFPDYELALYLRGTNLTDEEVRVHTSFLKDLAPLRGRSVLFGLRGVF